MALSLGHMYLNKHHWFSASSGILAIFVLAALLNGRCSLSADAGAKNPEWESRQSNTEGLALAPRMGGNVQGVFMKRRQVGGRYFYEFPAITELNITLSRGISGSGSTFSRYGDPSRDPLYAGHGWAKAAAEYPNLTEAQKAGRKRASESSNHYRDWIDMVINSPLKDMVVVANPYMPFEELGRFLDDAQTAGGKVLWLEAGNEMNSPADLKAWQEQLAQRDPSAARLDARARAQKAFDLYWDWVIELERFAEGYDIPVAYVGTPPAYAFPDMLDPETMGSKANLSQKKAQSDKFFNEAGSNRVRRGQLKGQGVSRHRYSQWDIIGEEQQVRNDDLRRRLQHPLDRNYFEELKRTEVDFYRNLYPNAKILLTEWAMRKSIAGAGFSMAASYDVAKTLIAMGQINAVYREQVVALMTFQNLFAEKMGALIFFEGQQVGLSPEGLTYSLFTVMDGQPILEIGQGDNVQHQWLQVRSPMGEALVYYNMSSNPISIPYSGALRYLQSEDILGEPLNVLEARADGQIPAHSVGVIMLD